MVFTQLLAAIQSRYLQINIKMDITQALKDTENALRDFITTCLTQQLGESWISKCGVTPERIKEWEKRKKVEEKRQEAGAVEERLLYYADFYDLKTILKKNWGTVFSIVFGDWKKMEVWLTEMEKLRDPDAHRRELLPHQKYLILGISGEIRTRLIKYRSKMETTEDFFPRIESARDNLGNIFTYGRRLGKSQYNLRPGDSIDFVITASDPVGDNLQFAMTLTVHHHNPNRQDENIFRLDINKEHVRQDFGVMIWLRSLREYHARGEYDDSVTFCYDVLPPKN